MFRELGSVALWTTAFLLFELPAKDVLGWAPWYSLSKTTELGTSWWWPVALWVALFMFVLLGHFEPTHWSVRWVIAAAVGGLFLISSHLIRRYV